MLNSFWLVDDYIILEFNVLKCFWCKIFFYLVIITIWINKLEWDGIYEYLFQLHIEDIIKLWCV
jgi:hypothetical protein